MQTVNSCHQVMYHYRRTPLAITDSTLNNRFVIGQSDSGWMTSDSFFKYISEHFLPWLIEQKIPTPVVLFLDGHASHMSLQLSLFCREHGIILIALLPNATHLLQPMDVGVFKSLKTNWRIQRSLWNANHPKEIFRKLNFGDCLKGALNSMAENVSLLPNAFQAAGESTN